MGLFRGNLDSQAPFIIQISKGARSYTDKRMLEGIIRAADEVFPEAVFAVHLDHGDYDACMDCIQSGFYSSVMIDASAEPLEENIRITREIVEAAHAKGIVVEAELGQLGGVEEHVQVEEKNANLTDPDEAKSLWRVRAATAWLWPSAPATGRTSSQETRACAWTSWLRSRSDCPVSLWLCTAPPPFPRKKCSVSTTPAGPSRRVPRGSTRTSSPRRYPWASPR